MIPRHAAIPGDREATIVADDEMIGVVRIHPERHVVAMQASAHRSERLALIVRHVKSRSQAVDPIPILRVWSHLDEEARGLIDPRAHVLPRVAAVEAAIHAALTGFEAAAGGHCAPGRRRTVRRIAAAARIDSAPHLDVRIHESGLRAREEDSDATFFGGGHSARDRRPRFAGISRLVESRSRTGWNSAEALSLPGVCGREHHAGIAGIERHVVRAGVLVDVQHLSPTAAAVGALEQPALGTRTPDVTLRCDEHDVGVRGVDGDTSDMAGFGEAHLRPRASRIDGLINAVSPAVRRILPFAGADPHDIRIRRRDGDLAHRHHRVHTVEDGGP